jgi:hypothetical protein
MKTLRLGLLALAATGALLAAVVLLQVAFSPRGAIPASDQPAAASQATLDARKADIVARIAATPDVARFFDRLKSVAPTDYEAAIARAASAPGGGPSDTPDFWLSDAVKIVRQSRGALAAHAQPQPLTDVFVRQRAILGALAARDARLCVDFLYGGASADFFLFAAANRPLVGDLAVAGLDAIASGQTAKIDRGAPTDADFQALESALRDKGLNPTEIAALLDGKSPDPPLPDARMCEIGQVYLDAMAALPEDVRLRLYALAVDLMARS